MIKYEYLGNREIMRRTSALSYRLPSGRLCSYSKYEGVEWLQIHKSLLIVLDINYTSS